MISGNCNRSPQQYPAMGRGAQKYGNNHHSFVQQQQPPTLLFMAGGNVGGYSQMPPSRGYSKVNSGAPLRSTIMQCRMQQGYGGGGHGYSANPYQAFPHHYGHFNHQQPQVIHCPPQNYIQPHILSQASVPSPAQLSGTAPSFGFINGIKNMVKGLIQPLNCDFYTDHHKYYNPKYRNNYIRDIASEKLQMNNTTAKPKGSCAQAAVLMGLKMGQALAGNVPKSSEAPSSCKNSPPKVSDVVAIFTSEDFPELPAPRKRSCPFTRANKTETTPMRVEKVQTSAAPTRLSQTPQKESPPRPAILPTPRSTFFEIKCTTTPCGRRPTFGGRLKVVPPPFSLKKSLQTCRTSCQQESMHPPQDCDTEDESFVIFTKNDSKEDRLLAALEARRCARQRQLSECSDDSFVVFFAGDTDSLVPIDDDDDDDFEEEDDDEDSDDDISSDEEDDSDLESDDDELNNGTDVVDSSFCGRNKTDRNKCAGIIQFEELPCADTEHEQFDSGFIENKKVSFDPKPVVHVMHAWNYAYRAARKGHWEDYARDRTRFQKRIERTSAYLNPILTPEHREKIYRSRFCDEPADQIQQSEPKTMFSSPPTATHCSDIIERLSTSTLPEPPQCAKF